MRTVQLNNIIYINNQDETKENTEFIQSLNFLGIAYLYQYTATRILDFYIIS